MACQTVIGIKRNNVSRREFKCSPEGTESTLAKQCNYCWSQMSLPTDGILLLEQFVTNCQQVFYRLYLEC